MKPSQILRIAIVVALLCTQSPSFGNTVTDPSAARPVSPSILWESFRISVQPGVQESEFFGSESFLILSSGERLEFFLLMAQDAPERLLRLRRDLSPDVRSQSVAVAMGQIEPYLIRKVERLSRNEQYALFLGRTPNMKGVAKGTQRHLSQESRVARLAKDPALEKNFERIETEWLSELASTHAGSGLLYLDSKQLVQTKIMIARNLFLHDRPVTRKEVRDEYLNILKLREQYRDVALFSGRNVVYAASNQRVRRDGPYVFAQDSTRRYLHRQGASVTFFRPGDTSKAIHAPQQQLSEELEDKPDLTFLFEGHGRDGEIQVGRGLTAKALARKIAARRPSENAPPPIVIPVACRSHNFSRNVLSHLHDLDPSIPKPITIAPVEFGQEFIKQVFSDPFLRDDLGLGQSSEKTTLGSVFDNARLATSVYVPNADNLPTQIL